MDYTPDIERRDSGPRWMDPTDDMGEPSPDDVRDERRDYDDQCALAQALTTGAAPW